MSLQGCQGVGISWKYIPTVRRNGRSISREISAVEIIFKTSVSSPVDLCFEMRVLRRGHPGGESLLTGVEEACDSSR